jgi:hypothetical protein
MRDAALVLAPLKRVCHCYTIACLLACSALSWSDGQLMGAQACRDTEADVELYSPSGKLKVCVDSEPVLTLSLHLLLERLPYPLPSRSFCLPAPIRTLPPPVDARPIDPSPASTYRHSGPSCLGLGLHRLQRCGVSHRLGTPGCLAHCFKLACKHVFLDTCRSVDNCGAHHTLCNADHPLL